uniref:MADS40 n=1 Tax=Erycina pusilla TaxID=154679 RepID=A0A1L1WKY1_9ASPA|nr:MADS40 [Erycina pusilla]
MGRAKLDLKYRKETRSRMNTYNVRIKSLNKKAKELSVLCGVDVLFSSFSPDLNTCHYWPNNPSDFNRILDRYKSIYSNSPPLNSSFQAEFMDFNKKLKEVKERICFLEAQKVGISTFSSQNIKCSEIIGSTEGKEKENEDIFSTQQDLHEDMFVSEFPAISCFNHDWNLSSQFF